VNPNTKLRLLSHRRDRRRDGQSLAQIRKDRKERLSQWIAKLDLQEKLLSNSSTETKLDELSLIEDVETEVPTRVPSSRPSVLPPVPSRKEYLSWTKLNKINESSAEDVPWMSFHVLPPTSPIRYPRIPAESTSFPTITQDTVVTSSSEKKMIQRSKSVEPSRRHTIGDMVTRDRVKQRVLETDKLRRDQMAFILENQDSARDAVKLASLSMDTNTEKQLRQARRSSSLSSHDETRLNGLLARFIPNPLVPFPTFSSELPS